MQNTTTRFGQNLSSAKWQFTSLLENSSTKTLIVLALALAYFIYLTAPAITWVNTDADGVIYWHAAKYRTLAHPTGAPLFNLINMAILETIPWGDEFWRLSLLSALASGATAALLTRLTNGYIAPLVFMASGVVVSQSTILETYALVSFFMVAQYYWRHNPWAIGILAAIGVGVHHLMLLSALPIMYWHWKQYGTWKPFLTMFAGLLWYLYLPLFNGEPRIFTRGDGIRDYSAYLTAQGRIILGFAIASQDLLIRVPDVLVTYFAGFGLASGVIILAARKDLETWLIALPFAHYALAFPHLQYIWTLPAFAFGGILTARWLLQYQREYIGLLVGAASVALIGLNLIAYDIGGRFLTNVSAVSFQEQLEDLPEDAVVWSNSRGWEHITTVLYNREHGTDLTNLRSHQLVDGLESHGITNPQLVAMAAAEIAERPIYKTVVLNPKTLHVIIVPTTGEDIWQEVQHLIYWPKPAPQTELSSFAQR